MNIFRWTPLLGAPLMAVGCLGYSALEDKAKTDEKTSEEKTQQPKLSLAKDLDAAQAQDGENSKQPKFSETRVAAKKGHVGVMTNRIYDFKKVTKLRPDLKVLKKSKGGTAFTSAYYSATSGASTANFERNIRIWKEANGGRWPTYQQLMTERDLQVKLAKLPSYQVYAYDDGKGKIYVLEDAEMKSKILDGK